MFNCPSLSVSVCVRVWPDMEGCPVQGRVPLCALRYQERLWPLMPNNWPKQAEKEFLLTFINLTYMYE